MSTIIMTVPKYLSFLTLACLVMLAFYLTPAMACTCRVFHPQTHYCHADYVIVAKFKDYPLSWNRFINSYDLKEGYTFKRTTEGENTLKYGHLLVGKEMASSCGRDIALNKWHIIAGKKSLLTACDFVEPYEKLTSFQLQGFHGEYEKGCSCEINSETGCKWTFYDVCESKFSTCVRNKISGQCAWMQTPEYEECKSKQRN